MIETGKNIEYISSDELRKERPNDKDNHIAIFDEMHRRTLASLNGGADVIYDSTNLETKFRKKLFDKVKNDNKNARVFAVFIHKGVKNAMIQSQGSIGRDDVNNELIAQMYQTMQLPIIGVDCDAIIIPGIKLVNNNYKLVESKIFGKDNFDDFVEKVRTVDAALVLKYNKEIKGDKDEI